MVKNVNKAVVGKSLLISGVAATVAGGVLLYLDKKDNACCACAETAEEADEELPTLDAEAAE